MIIQYLKAAEPYAMAAAASWDSARHVPHLHSRWRDVKARSVVAYAEQPTAVGARPWQAGCKTTLVTG